MVSSKSRFVPGSVFRGRLNCFVQWMTIDSDCVCTPLQRPYSSSFPTVPAANPAANRRPTANSSDCLPRKSPDQPYPHHNPDPDRISRFQCAKIIRIIAACPTGPVRVTGQPCVRKFRKLQEIHHPIRIPIQRMIDIIAIRIDLVGPDIDRGPHHPFFAVNILLSRVGQIGIAFIDTEGIGRQMDIIRLVRISKIRFV